MKFLPRSSNWKIYFSSSFCGTPLWWGHKLLSFNQCKTVSIIIFEWSRQLFAIDCILLLLFFCHPCLWHWNYISIFVILKISQYGRLRWQVFPYYSCKNWYKNWFLHFHKTYDHQTWQAEEHLEDLTKMRLIKLVLATLLHKDHVTFNRCSKFLSARVIIIKFGLTFHW